MIISTYDKVGFGDKVKKQIGGDWGVSECSRRLEQSGRGVFLGCGAEGLESYLNADVGLSDRWPISTPNKRPKDALAAINDL